MPVGGLSFFQISRHPLGLRDILYFEVAAQISSSAVGYLVEFGAASLHFVFLEEAVLDKCRKCVVKGSFTRWIGEFPLSIEKQGRCSQRIWRFIEKFQDRLRGFVEPTWPVSNDHITELLFREYGSYLIPDTLCPSFGHYVQTTKYLGHYVHANDWRSATRGHVGWMRKSAPVRERFAVVPGMRPDDRARMYEPGMDNCIGRTDSYHSAKGVSA